MSASRRVHPELPLFAIEEDGAAMLYAPGHLSRIRAADLPALVRQLHGPSGQSALGRVAHELRWAAEEAQRTWAERLRNPFAPECLLLYLSNRCNLGCGYCYSAAARQTGTTLSEGTIRAGARRVARACAKKQLPFTLVLHGGGEPTAEFDLVRRAVDLTRNVAAENGLTWKAHVATNGVLSEERARWLAREIRSIGLSCDGPPDLHDRLRPLQGGGASSPTVRRTARAVCAEGGQIEVRATVVPESVDRQAEIVSYAVEALGAEAVRLEPVYAVRAPERSPFTAIDAERFVGYFLDAEQAARHLGVGVSYAGVRLGELHGPHCSALRDVLHLLPDGSATACFFCAESGSAGGRCASIGRWDPAGGELVLDEERLRDWRRRVGTLPAACRECVAQAHCARECPEVCAGVNDDEPRGGFRCRVARLLSEAWIREAAAELPHSVARPTGVQGRIVYGDTGAGEAEHLEVLLRELPEGVDADSIRGAWRAARTYQPIEARGLPEPVWARRDYEHDGEVAWRTLTDLRPRDHGAIAVYVHVPFCDVRCPFCDCYSVASPRARRSAREGAFVAALLDEVAAWGVLPCARDRPVTTVHFGGGTPNHLSEADFDRILEALRSCLGVHSGTEWALESTSRLLEDRGLVWLLERGFRRLHVGVQTLEDPVRRAIGRHEDAARVLERLSSALAHGATLSVDLVYGLPGQTATGWVETLRRVIAAGVHGVSLYQLQVTARNDRFLARVAALERDPLREYVLFQCAEQELLRAGLAKNHFTHFARARDENLYYRHQLRGEDLLALGPTADGVFGGYHYRHAELIPYVERRACLGLEGGMWESAAEGRVGPATAALMSGTVSLAALAEIGAAGLVDRWLACGLVRRGQTPSDLILTASGSWFLRAMLRELERTSSRAR